MNTQHDARDILSQLKQWGEHHDSIRTMLLTSTRANPNLVVDIFSDYDVVLVVRDIHPFFDDRGWVHFFGDVLVTYWDPIYLAPNYGIEQFGNVIQYADGLHIDFTLWPVELLRRIIESKTLPADLDVGYMVLMDKDNITDGMQSPSYTVYIPKRPTKETFQKVVEDFYSDVPYVAKCLLRDELMPAKWCLDFDMKHIFLRQMLEWRVQLDHDWSEPVGNLGKGLKKKLAPSIWSKLEKTYVGAGVSENWNALFAAMSLFREVGEDVSRELGFVYPIDLDQRVTTFAQKMSKLNAEEKARRNRSAS